MLYVVFNETPTTESYTYCYTLSLHDALPICRRRRVPAGVRCDPVLRAQLSGPFGQLHPGEPAFDACAYRARMVFLAVLRDPARLHLQLPVDPGEADRKSTRLNSSH